MSTQLRYDNQSTKGDRLSRYRVITFLPNQTNRVCEASSFDSAIKKARNLSREHSLSNFSAFSSVQTFIPCARAWEEHTTVYAERGAITLETSCA